VGSPPAEVAIANLVYAYAERIDAGDFDAIGELLAHATITNEGFAGDTAGAAAITALYTRTTRRYAGGTPNTKHVCTNLVVEVDHASGATTAAARSYFTVLQAVPGQLTLQPIIAGRYHDRFERVDGEWRAAARHIVIDLVGDLSHHLLIDLPS